MSEQLFARAPRFSEVEFLLNRHARRNSGRGSARLHNQVANFDESDIYDPVTEKARTRTSQKMIAYRRRGFGNMRFFSSLTRRSVL